MKALAACLLVLASPAWATDYYFKIRVVDQNLVPVPGVRLSTTAEAVFLTDAEGFARFYEPGQMSQTVNFFVEKEGYLFTHTSLKVPAITLQTVPGKSVRLQMSSDPAILAPRTVRQLAWDFSDQNRVPAPSEYFHVQIADEKTGRGVPLIQLKYGERSYYSDSAGNIAFYDPSQNDQSLDVELSGHGYESVHHTVVPSRGGSALLSIKRKNIAERLYRITGSAIYRDSVLLGLPVPVQKPLLNAQVMGQDTVFTAIYSGKIFWVWGDTNVLGRSHGNFLATGATSELPTKGGLDPNVGVDLTYFATAADEPAAMSPQLGPGAVWLGNLVALPDAQGSEHLLANYIRVLPSSEIVEQGRFEFNPARNAFDKTMEFPGITSPFPGSGKPTRLTVEGVERVYIGPSARVEPTLEAYMRPEAHEVYSPHLPDLTVERDAAGTPVYRWRSWQDFANREYSPTKDLTSEENPWGQVREMETGALIYTGGITMHWNPYRKRFVAFVNQLFGTSFLGELWYLEADTPMGPWVYAKKVVTHDTYSSYHVHHHPYFDQENGRVLFFEATLTIWPFTPAQLTPVPRYNYNQIQYKIDLADERLNLPVPVYGRGARLDTRKTLPGSPETSLDIAFFALEKAAEKTIPILMDLLVPRKNAALYCQRYEGAAAVREPFVPLYRYWSLFRPFQFSYSTRSDLKAPLSFRFSEPACLVWRNPLRLPFPVGEYLEVSEPQPG